MIVWISCPCQNISITGKVKVCRTMECTPALNFPRCQAYLSLEWVSFLLQKHIFGYIKYTAVLWEGSCNYYNCNLLFPSTACLGGNSPLSFSTAAGKHCRLWSHFRIDGHLELCFFSIVNNDAWVPQDHCSANCQLARRVSCCSLRVDRISELGKTQPCRL